MLVIDGELWKVPVSAATYFDYFIGQAYSVSGGTPSPNAGQSESNMDSRLTQIINRFGGVMSEEEITKRFIVTENMESAIDALNGGYFWTLRNGTRLDKAECRRCWEWPDGSPSTASAKAVSAVTGSATRR